MVGKGSKVKGSIDVRRNAKNPRDLDITLKSSYRSNKTGAIEQEREYLMR